MKGKKNKLRDKVYTYTKIGLLSLVGLLVLFILCGISGDFWNKWTEASRSYYAALSSQKNCNDQPSEIYTDEERRQNDLLFCLEKIESTKTWPITNAFDAVFDDLRLWFGVFVYKSISNIFYSWYTIFFILVCIGFLLILYRPAFLNQQNPYHQGPYGNPGGSDRIIFLQGVPGYQPNSGQNLYHVQDRRNDVEVAFSRNLKSE